MIIKAITVAFQELLPCNIYRVATHISNQYSHWFKRNKFLRVNLSSAVPAADIPDLKRLRATTLSWNAISADLNSSSYNKKHTSTCLLTTLNYHKLNFKPLYKSKAALFFQGVLYESPFFAEGETLAKWQTEFRERFASIPDDTTLQIVDAHSWISPVTFSHWAESIYLPIALPQVTGAIGPLLSPHWSR